MHSTIAFYSDNDAQSWTPVSLPSGITSNLLLPYGGDTLFIAMDSTLWRSTNLGSNWTIALHTHGKISDVKRTTAGGILLTTPNYIYRSTNKGFQWDSQVAPFDASQILYPHLTIFPTDQGTFLEFRRDTLSKLFRSDNDGIDWLEKTIPDTSNYISIWDMESFQGQLWASVGAWLYVSSDSGTTWTHKLGPSINSLESIGDTLLAGGSNGLFKSYDAAKTWISGNLGFDSLIAQGSGFLMPELLGFVGDRLYATTFRGLMHTENDGQEWVLVNEDNYSNQLISKGDSIIVFGYGASRSLDNGANWEHLSSEDIDNNPLASSEWEFALANNNLFALTWFNNKIYKSFDWGQSWQPLGTNAVFYDHIATAGNKIYITDGSIIKVSSNNGQSFATLTTGLSANAYIENLWSAGNQMFTLSNGQLYRLVNNQWKPATIGLFDVFGQLPNIETIIGNSALKILIGTSSSSFSPQMFISTNNGESWVGNLMEGLPNMYQFTAAVHDNTIYVYGRGIDFNKEYFWKTDISVATNEAINPIPSLAVQPNPASGEAFLTTESAGDQNLFVEISDNLGRILRPAEAMAGNRHRLSLSGLPAGLVFVTVRSQEGKIFGHARLVVHQ